MQSATRFDVNSMSMKMDEALQKARRNCDSAYEEIRKWLKSCVENHQLYQLDFEIESNQKGGKLDAIREVSEDLNSESSPQKPFVGATPRKPVESRIPVASKGNGAVAPNTLNAPTGSKGTAPSSPIGNALGTPKASAPPAPKANSPTSSKGNPPNSVPSRLLSPPNPLTRVPSFNANSPTSSSSAVSPSSKPPNPPSSSPRGLGPAPSIPSTSPPSRVNHMPTTPSPPPAPPSSPAAPAASKPSSNYDMTQNYRHFTSEQLVSECQHRGITAVGSRTDMIELLVKDDIAKSDKSVPSSRLEGLIQLKNEDEERLRQLRQEEEQKKTRLREGGRSGSPVSPSIANLKNFFQSQASSSSSSSRPVSSRLTPSSPRSSPQSINRSWNGSASPRVAPTPVKSTPTSVPKSIPSSKPNVAATPVKSSAQPSSKSPTSSAPKVQTPLKSPTSQTPAKVPVSPASSSAPPIPPPPSQPKHKVNEAMQKGAASPVRVASPQKAPQRVINPVPQPTEEEVETWYEGKLLDEYLRRQQFIQADIIFAPIETCDLKDIFPNDRHIPNARGSSGNWENEPMSEVTRMSLAKIEADDV